MNVNPNIVETLYVDRPQDIIFKSSIWDGLIEKIKPQISQKAHTGFHGYSLAQLKKMMVKQANKTGRVELAEKYGFDSKFAMHGFRISQEGAELLKTGKITFPRPNTNELLDIRNGKTYTKEESEKCYVAWEKEASNLDEALKTSILPKSYDFEAYNQILIDTYEKHVWGMKGHKDEKHH